MKDNDLYKLELDGSDLQFLQLNGKRLMWTGDLESLKKFVMSKSASINKGNGRSPEGTQDNSRVPITTLL